MVCTFTSDQVYQANSSWTDHSDGYVERRKRIHFTCKVNTSVRLICKRCCHQVVENGNIVLSGGYVNLTDDSSDNSPLQSNNNEQIVKVHRVAS